MITSKVDKNNNTMDGLLKVESNLPTQSDEKMLVLAVKDVQFVQPEVNLLTMSFEHKEEAKYRAYLMGTPQTNTTNSFQSIYQANNIWTNPSNVLFLSMLVTFIINLCVSTAFFLTFIVSTMTSYKQTQKYKLNFYLIVIIYFILFVLQSVFLFFYFIKCSKLLSTTHSSSNKKDKNTQPSNHNRTSNVSLADQSFKDQLIKHDYQSVRLANRNNKKLERSIQIKYTLLHCVAFFSSRLYQSTFWPLVCPLCAI